MTKLFKYLIFSFANLTNGAPSPSGNTSGQLNWPDSLTSRGSSESTGPIESTGSTKSTGPIESTRSPAAPARRTWSLPFPEQTRFSLAH